MNRYLQYFHRIFISIIAILAIAPMARAFDVSTYATSSRLSTGKWAMVKITSDGMYKITASDISHWGFSDLSKIRVYGYGGAPIPDYLSIGNYIDDLPQVPVIRTSNSILFYGKSQDSWERLNSTELTYRQVQHPYSQYACYFITENAAVPDLTYQKSTVTPTQASPVTTFLEHTYYEKELYSPGMTGRLLLGDDFKYKTSQDFKFTLTGLVPNTTVTAYTAFASKVMNGSSSISFKNNGKSLSSTASDVIRPVTSPEYEHVKIIETAKKFELSDPDLTYNITFTNSGTLFTARLDYITLNYQRKLELSKNQLFFRGAGNVNMALAGASSTTRILDITSTIPVEMNAVLNSSTATFNTGSKSDNEYIAFDDNATFPSPTLVSSVSNQDLHAEAVPDMVIITPAEFKAQAQRIADFHALQDSMKVLVITPQLIYNEFSSGTPDINAYRKMLKMFYDRGIAEGGRKLGYLLLFGRSSYDNRQITDKVRKASYPMLLNWQSLAGDNENTSFNTDDILGFLDDNSGIGLSSDKLRIGIGRMPIKSVEEAKTVVDKLLSYASNKNRGTWKNNVLVIADDEDNGIHMDQAETVINNLKNNGGKNYMYNRVYQDAYEATSIGAGRFYPDARKAMFNTFTNGVIYAHYIGHANPTGWTHDGLLSLTDINQKFFYKNPPLLYTATCEFTRWDSDDVSGGELMFLNSAGGVLGLITSSRVVYIADNGVLGGLVASQLFKKDSNGNYQRLGDILSNGKNSYPRANENKVKYMLIGDPALRLNYPTYTISIDSINHVATTSEEQPTIQARQQVELCGKVYDSDGNLANDFQGSVIPKLYDAEVSVQTHGYGNGKEKIIYERSNILYIGQDSVVNGEYKIKFNMPSEISNNWSPALLNLYATDSKGKEANGSNEDFYIYGYSTTTSTDTVGPKIDYFALNTTDFTSGSSVNESPLVLASFNDESGINISNVGIGHQITLLLDDETTYNDVCNYYMPVIGDLNKGTISYQLSNLSEGEHKLRLKVWDINNNSSESQINFNVVKGLAPELYDVYTTSSPASVEASFYLKHNRPDALITVKLEVFDLMGRPVWSQSQTGKSDMFTSFPITWNLCDNVGRRVSRGIYIYRASISTDGVQETTKSKKLAVTAE